MEETYIDMKCSVRIYSVTTDEFKTTVELVTEKYFKDEEVTKGRKVSVTRSGNSFEGTTTEIMEYLNSFDVTDNLFALSETDAALLEVEDYEVN